MPKFVDFHAKMPQLPPEVMKSLSETVRAGRSDEFGVKGLNAYFTADGRAWCISEADSAEAVCKSHEAKGVRLDKGDVHEVKSLI
jgi:hypothetical protein